MAMPMAMAKLTIIFTWIKLGIYLLGAVVGPENCIALVLTEAAIFNLYKKSWYSAAFTIGLVISIMGDIFDIIWFSRLYFIWSAWMSISMNLSQPLLINNIENMILTILAKNLPSLLYTEFALKFMVDFHTWYIINKWAVLITSTPQLFVTCVRLLDRNRPLN